MTTPLEREFDQVLATITKHCDDDTQQLMDVFFGFLSRRTDFFASQLPSQSKQAVLGAFQEQWERLDEIMQERRQEQEEIERRKESMRKVQIEAERVNEAKLISEKPVDPVILKTVGEFEKEKPKETKKPKPPSDDEEKISEKENKKAPEPSKPEKKKKPKVHEETPEEKAKREQEEAVELTRIMPNAGNGCDLPNYKWTQTTQQIEISVPLRAGVPLTGRDVVIEMGKKHLKVGVRGRDPVIDGDLFSEVKINDDATWMLVDKSVVNIVLPKAKVAPNWSKLITTDPEVSTKKMQSDTVNLCDLEDDHRAVVEKMMFDNNAKQMGLPTSEERQKMAMIQKLKKINPNLQIDPSQIQMPGSRNSFSF